MDNVFAVIIPNPPELESGSLELRGLGEKQNRIKPSFSCWASWLVPKPQKKFLLVIGSPFLGPFSLIHFERVFASRV